MRKRYDLYKDSGVEWIGEIPSSWNRIKLMYLMGVDGFRSGPFGSSLITSELCDEGNIQVLSPEFVSKGNEEFPLFVPKEREEELSKYLVREGDIVIPIVGTLGKGKIIDNKVPRGILNQRLCRITPDQSKINLYFIHLLLTDSELVKIQYKLEKKGSILDHITREVLFNINLPLPPLSEQLQIVEYLDTKTSMIDSLIVKTHRKIELLKEKRTSLINEVVTKGLNPNVEMKDSGVEWIGEIPKHWKVSKFKYVSEIVTGNTPSKTDGGDYYSTEGFLWIKPTYLLGDRYVNDSDEKLTELGKTQTRVIPKDSIMICCIGNTIGKYGISGEEVSTNQQINSVIPIIKFIEPWYCLYFIDVFTRDLLNRSNFVTLPILTKSDLENIEVIVPPIGEQNNIVEVLRNQLSTIEKTISIEERRIELLKEYRQSLISEVVTGKVKVTTDEHT